MYLVIASGEELQVSRKFWRKEFPQAYLHIFAIEFRRRSSTPPRYQANNDDNGPWQRPCSQPFESPPSVAPH